MTVKSNAKLYGQDLTGGLDAAGLPRTIWRRLTVAALIIILPVINFAALFPRWGLGPCEDDLIQYLPQRFFLGLCLAAGKLPLWNPFVYGGYPAAGDPQMAIWYLPNWLFALLPIGLAYPAVLIGHWWLAGWGMYKLMRIWRCCRGASLLASVAWMFCGFMIGHRVHLTMVCSAAYLPAVLWAYQRWLARPDLRHLSLAAILAGMQLLAGHVQMAALTGVVVLAYGLCVRTTGPKRLDPSNNRGRLRPLFTAALGALAMYCLAVGLYAVQLLPTIELLGQSVRTSNSYRFFTENSFHPLAFLLWFFPALLGLRSPNWLYDQQYFGPWNLCELTCYASIIVVVLAVWIALTRWQDRRVRFLVILAVVGMFLAIGRGNPVYKLLFHVPLYSCLRCPARFLLWVNFALAALAGLGWDRLIRSPDSYRYRRKLLRFACYFLPALAGGSIGYFIFMRYLAQAVDWSNRLPEAFAELSDNVLRVVRIDNPAILIPIGLMAGTLAVICWLPRLRSAGAVLTMLLGLLVIDLGSFMSFSDIATDRLTRGPEILSSPAGAYLNRLGGDRMTSYWPLSNDPYDQPLKMLHPYTNLLYVQPRQVDNRTVLIGPAAINGYGPLLTSGARQLLGWQLWGSTDRWLEVALNASLITSLGIQYIIAEPQIASVIETLRDMPSAAAGPESFSRPQQMVVPLGKSAVKLTVPGKGKVVCLLNFQARLLGGQEGRLFITASRDQTDQPVATICFNSWDFSHRWTDLQAVLLLGGNTERAIYLRADHAPVEIRNVQGRLDWPTNMDYLQPVDALPSGQTIYRNNNYAGRIYLAQQVTGAGNRDQAIKSLRSMVWQSSAAGPLCVLEAPETVTPPRGPSDGQISDIHWDLNTISFKVQLSQRGVVVIADSFDPAWRGELDGRAIDIYRANAIHKAVIVPAGTHQVTLRFSPISVYLGLAISLVTAAVLVWALVFGNFWPRAAATDPRAVPTSGGLAGKVY